MKKHLVIFRPGEESRMLARCQFGLHTDGRCGATFTYPIKGYPWRHNPTRSYEFTLSNEQQSMLFLEVHRLMNEHHDECLDHSQLWSDHSEKANAITRDRQTDTLCYTINIISDGGANEASFSIRESSEAFIESSLYKLITELLRPYELL